MIHQYERFNLLLGNVLSHVLYRALLFLISLIEI